MNESIGILYTWVPKNLTSKVKILIVASAGQNKGSESTIKSTISSLKQFPNADVYLLSMLPEIDSRLCEGKTFGYPMLPPAGLAHFRKILGLLLCFMLATIYRLLDGYIDSLFKMDKSGLLKLYAQPDVVVFCSGDMISDTYGGLVTLVQFLKDIMLCALLKKPIVLNGAQIGPFKRNLKGKICMFLTKLVLNKVNLITARDHLSAVSLRDANVNKPVIYVTADSAFLLQPPSLERIKLILDQERVPEDKSLIGINPSGLVYRYSKAADVEKKLGNYLELLEKIANYVIEKLDATVILLPHVFAPRAFDDRIIGEKILQRVGRKNKVKLITQVYEAEELKGIIGQLDLLVSPRMHPIIHAISMQTPVVGIDYTFKTTELMKRVDQQEYVCDINTVDYEELKSKIDNAYLNRDKIRKTLKTRSEKLEKQAFLNARLIMELAGQTS